ncbi:hypothetical protein NEMBOFW57_001207 [Staphylotrichum longicolle]|uniref:Protein kinase domain-containing protein n=1 Tax=Staphylotrichum longicolle TaxID=669026 RepID=A0AAD4I2D6_9PEZI|nr:hypothetical protein NEMBOFW57_001207 [Staphylotrichum longicolle]
MYKHVIRLVHHQGWAEGHPVEIFMPLCEGNVDDLFEPYKARHECKSPPNYHKPKWLHDFIDQVLDALSFLQKNKILHHDLKSDNILYTRSKDKGVTYRFLLSDFGLSITRRRGVWDNKKPGALAYRAPELTQSRKPHPNSDVYSFGIMLLELLGVYCGDEATQEFSWREKLKGFHVRNYNHYRDEVPERGADWGRVEDLRGHSRVESLATYGIVPSAFMYVLERDPAKRSSAADARSRLLPLRAQPRNGPSEPDLQPPARNPPAVSFPHIGPPI